MQLAISVGDALARGCDVINIVIYRAMLATDEYLRVRDMKECRQRMIISKRDNTSDGR